MYTADSKRYETMQYNRCGASGLKLPIVSLGLWHNFGDTGCYDNMKAMCRTAFDHGITHFDLANNYGPAYGSAERITSDRYISLQHAFPENQRNGNCTGYDRIFSLQLRHPDRSI